MNTIYKITNSVNGKVYIGQTTQGFEQRKREHICRYNRGERNHKLYLAMRKYGIDYFIFEPICSALSQEYLNQLEIHLIAEYNSYNRGYNMTIGGDSISLETRQKLSAKNKGRKITWYDKILESRKNNKEDRTIKTHLLLNSFGLIMEVRNLKQFCFNNKIDCANLFHKSKQDKFTKGYILLERSTTSSTERRE